jgi:thiosulfate/3-mercaptopyruvate sulfurtransferase
MGLRILASFVPMVAWLPILQPAGYANPQLLAETSWVAEHADEPDVRLVDMRDAAAYAAGHLPGAVRIEEGPLRNPEDRLTYLPKPDALARMMGQAGISNSTRVVIYDDQGGKMAARLWYVLAAYGHDRASLLNGGWNKWTAEKRPVTQEAPSIVAAIFTPRPVPALSCPSTELLVRRPGVVVLDVRSPQEYRGEQTSPGAEKAGASPARSTWSGGRMWPVPTSSSRARRIWGRCMPARASRRTGRS